MKDLKFLKKSLRRGVIPEAEDDYGGLSEGEAGRA